MSANVLCHAMCCVTPRNFVVDGDDVDDVIVDVDVVVAVCQDAGPSVILLPQPQDLADLLCID